MRGPIKMHSTNKARDKVTGNKGFLPCLDPAMSGNFRGVSAEQDGRFGDKTKKLLKSTKFPESFNPRVDMGKVQVRDAAAIH